MKEEEMSMIYEGLHAIRTYEAAILNLLWLLPVQLPCCFAAQPCFLHLFELEGFSPRHVLRKSFDVALPQFFYWQAMELAQRRLEDESHRRLGVYTRMDSPIDQR